MRECIEIVQLLQIRQKAISAITVCSKSAKPLLYRVWYFEEGGHFVSKDLSVLKVINHKTKCLLSLHQATASDAVNKDSNSNKNNLNLYNMRLLKKKKSHLQYLILRLWSRKSILICVPCDIKDWTEENVLPQTIIEHWNDIFHI